MKQFPQFHECRYFMNPATGYFEKQPQRESFQKLPFDLKIEPTQDKKIIANGANEVIHGRIQNGRYKFFTGLIPTGFNDLFVGNDYEFIKGKKINSMVLFKFYAKGAKLAVYYFNDYTVYPKKRPEFIAQFVKLQKELKSK